VFEEFSFLSPPDFNDKNVNLAGLTNNLIFDQDMFPEISRLSKDFYSKLMHTVKVKKTPGTEELLATEF
jgi:hypothetical protein